jgi:hypothetical protein
MTEKEIESRPGGLRLDHDPVQLPGVAGTSVELKAGPNKRLDEIALWVPAPALKAIELAWGPPSPIDPEYKIWFDAPRFDERQRQRASIRADGSEKNQLLFNAFLPTESWFGEGPKIAALPDRLIGESVADLVGRDDVVLAAQPEANAGQFVLELPATRWGDRHTKVTLSASDGTITSVSWFTRYATVSERDALLALFERKWGAPSALALGWKFAYDGTKVLVHDQRPMLAITIERLATGSGAK